MQCGHRYTPTNWAFLVVLCVSLAVMVGCGKPKYTSEPLSATQAIVQVQSSVDFESVLLGDTKYLETIIRNIGNSPLIIRSIRIPDEQRFIHSKRASEIYLSSLAIVAK